MDAMKLLIVCPLVFLAGFVDSIGGGGGIISLPAFIMAGLPPHVALGTNKLSSCLGTMASTGRYLRKGYLRGIGATALWASASALLGSALGARLALLIPGSVIEHMMLLVLPIVAFFVLRNKRMGRDERTGTLPPMQVRLISMAAGFIIGIYDGLYGPGTGTFLLLIMTGLAHLSTEQASAQTKVINLSSNVAALLTFMLHGNIAYGIGLSAAACCIAGHCVGSGLVVRDGTRIVRPIIIFVLLAIFIRIIYGRL